MSVLVARQTDSPLEYYYVDRAIVRGVTWLHGHNSPVAAVLTVTCVSLAPLAFVIINDTWAKQTSNRVPDTIVSTLNKSL